MDNELRETINAVISQNTYETSFDNVDADLIDKMLTNNKLLIAKNSTAHSEREIVFYRKLYKMVDSLSDFPEYNGMDEYVEYMEHAEYQRGEDVDNLVTAILNEVRNAGYRLYTTKIFKDAPVFYYGYTDSEKGYAKRLYDMSDEELQTESNNILVTSFLESKIGPGTLLNVSTAKPYSYEMIEEEAFRRDKLHLLEESKQIISDLQFNFGRRWWDSYRRSNTGAFF